MSLIVAESAFKTKRDLAFQLRTDIVEKIHGIVLEDRRIKVREIVEVVGISTERMHHILHEKLSMKKLCERWVPRLLTVGVKTVDHDW
jgi:predicted XRE-type DNA-binding protein